MPIDLTNTSGQGPDKGGDFDKSFRKFEQSILNFNNSTNAFEKVEQKFEAVALDFSKFAQSMQTIMQSFGVIAKGFVSFSNSFSEVINTNIEVSTVLNTVSEQLLDLVSVLDGNQNQKNGPIKDLSGLTKEEIKKLDKIIKVSEDEKKGVTKTGMTEFLKDVKSLNKNDVSELNKIIKDGISEKASKEKESPMPDFMDVFKKGTEEFNKFITEKTKQVKKQDKLNKDKEFLEKRGIIPPDPNKKKQQQQKGQKKGPKKAPTGMQDIVAQLVQNIGNAFGQALQNAFAMPVKRMFQDVADAIASPFREAMDIIGAPFRKISEVVHKGAEGIKRGFSILGDQMDALGDNIGQQTEYIIKNLFGNKALNAAIQSTTVGLRGMAHDFKILNMQMDFRHFGLEQAKGLQQDFNKVGDELIGAIKLSLINPIRGLPNLGKTVSEFVKYFDPSTVALFESVLRDFYAVIGKALQPVLKGIIRSLKKFGDWLYAFIDRVQPAIAKMVEAFEAAFEKAIPKILGLFEFFITEFANDVVDFMAVFDNFLGVWEGVAAGFAFIAKGFAEAGVFIPRAINFVADTLFAGGQSIAKAFKALAETIPGIGKGLGEIFGGFENAAGAGRDIIARKDRDLAGIPGKIENMVADALGGNFANRMRNAMNRFANAGLEPKDITGLAAPMNPGFQALGDAAKEAAKRSFGASGRDEELKNGLANLLKGQNPPIPVQPPPPPKPPKNNNQANAWNVAGQWNDPNRGMVGIQIDF